MRVCMPYIVLVVVLCLGSSLQAESPIGSSLVQPDILDMSAASNITLANNNVTDVDDELCTNGEEWDQLMKLLKVHGECGALQEYYKMECVNHTELATKHCQAVKSTYEARCAEDTEQNMAIDIIVVFGMVILSCVIGDILAKYHFTYLPQSGATILVGMAIGGVLSRLNLTNGMGTINKDVFFLFLLPPIIFHASAFAPDKTQIFSNMPSIVLFAVVGTLIAFLTSSVLVYSWGLLPFNESFLYGSLISSIDPIAILAVFSNFGVDPQLNTLVFGESMANDGVAVVLYETLLGRLNKPMDWAAVGDCFSSFCVVFFGSAGMGLACGLLIALITKHVSFHHSGPQTEMIVIICLVFAPYFICQALDWSGIVALMVEALIMEAYTFHNISVESHQHMEFFFECAASICETSIFLYLGIAMSVDESRIVWDTKLFLGSVGASLISRIASVFPLVLVLNLGRKDKITWRNAVMMWYSGLRGAIAFALVTNIPKFDAITGTGTHYHHEMDFMTSASILATVFVQGGLALPVLRLLGIKMSGMYDGLKETQTADEESKDSAVLDQFNSLQRFIYNRMHVRTLVPLLARSMAQSVEVTAPVEFYGPYNKPERRLSMSVANLVLAGQESDIGFLSRKNTVSSVTLADLQAFRNASVSGTPVSRLSSFSHPRLPLYATDSTSLLDPEIRSYQSLRTPESQPNIIRNATP